MLTKSNIYLIGPMGAGKSSVGKLLAKKLGRKFFDSDHEIERTTGVSISWIFDVEREEGFRKREELVIQQLTDQNNIVLATGGGSILFPTNRQRMTETGTVIYLQVALDEQLDRTSRRKGTRPLMNAPNVRERLQTLNSQRETLYREIAQHTYETHEYSVSQIVNLITKDLNL